MEFVSIEAATGIVRRRFAVPDGAYRYTVHLEDIAPDSKTFVSRGPDLSAIVWDLLGLDEARKLGPLRPDDLEALWRDLAEVGAAKPPPLKEHGPKPVRGHVPKEDPVPSRQALARLVVAGEPARDFLAKKLQPAQPVDAKRLAKLIQQLVDDDEAARKNALDSLRALDRQAEPALKKALNAAPPQELQKRIEQLLNEMDGLLPSGPILQQVRAVEALEYLQARQALSRLADADPASRLTQEAQQALRRLGPSEPRP
jgi:hypothetical protein